MERMTVSILAIGAIFFAGAAEAATSGAVCRAECVPRIDEQCGTVRSRARQACRRQLVQACKQTSPTVACTTTSDMTLALADRSFALGAGSGAAVSSGQLTLCADGRFAFLGASGTWEVTIASGELRLQLRADPAPGSITDGTSNTIQLSEGQQFRVARAEDDVVLFDDVPVDAADAGAACSGSLPKNGAPGRPLRGSGDTADPVRQLSAALAGHALVVEENIGLGRRTTIIVLCASGRHALEVAVSAARGPAQAGAGTWSAGFVDGQPILTLVDDGGAGRQFVIGADDEGGLFLDGVTVSEGDSTAVPGICARL